MASFYKARSRTPPTSRSSWSAPSRSTRRCRCSRATSARCRRPAQPSSRFKDVGITFPASIEKAHGRKGARAEGARRSSASPPIRRSRRTSRSESRPRPTCSRSRCATSCARSSGETYSVSVGLSQPLPQATGGSIGVSFGAAPENVDTMIERVLQEVRRLQDEGPSADLTNRAKESARRTTRPRSSRTASGSDGCSRRSCSAAIRRCSCIGWSASTR